MADQLIEPIAGAQPAVEITPTEPQTEAPPTDQGAELSDELLKIGAVQALMAGSPPAASMNIKALSKSPEGKIIASNAESLKSAGFGFYRALSGDIGVIFNGLFLPAEQLQAADKAGQLNQIAPDFQTLSNAADKSGEINPVLNAQTPAGPPTPPAPPVPQMSAGTLPPPPASAQKSLAGARAKNLQEGSPTSGRAAQGRLLNNLLKPAI